MLFYTPLTSFYAQPRLRPLDDAHSGDKLQTHFSCGIGIRSRTTTHRLHHGENTGSEPRPTTITASHHSGWCIVHSSHEDSHHHPNKCRERPLLRQPVFCENFASYPPMGGGRTRLLWYNPILSVGPRALPVPATSMDGDRLDFP